MQKFNQELVMVKCCNIYLSDISESLFLTEYVNVLMEELVRLSSDSSTAESTDEVPPFLCSQYDQPASKHDAVQEKQRRFNVTI